MPLVTTKSIKVVKEKHKELREGVLFNLQQFLLGGALSQKSQNLPWT